MRRKRLSHQQRSSRRAGRAALVAALLGIAPGVALALEEQRPHAQIVDVQIVDPEKVKIIARAQRIPVQRVDVLEANDGAANPNNVGVFVRDSAVAAEKLALAERMQGLKEWDTSAEVYQEVLDQYADRVLPIHTDAQGRPDRFGSVTRVVQDRLAAWPEEGRAVYLARYELPARRLLENTDAGDRAALMQVVNRYFLTAAGRDASMMLIESYFDHAEFIAAAMASDRLIDKHPQIDGLEPILLTRSALSWHLAGEPARAKARAEQLASKHPEAIDTIGGKPRVLSETVSSALATTRRPSRPGTANAWPVPFGSNSRSAVASEAVDPSNTRIWARLETIPLRRPRSIAGQNQFENAPLIQRQNERGASTGILPSIDGGQLFYQDNAGIYAYDLDRGGPLMGWRATYPGTGAYTIQALATPRNVQMTTTVTDAHVLAILGQSEPIDGAGGSTETQVACLDRMTGRLLWNVKLGELQTQDESLRLAKPCGSVLVTGDSVYFVARSRRPGAFEDSFLCSVSLADGSLRWTRHLASGNSPRVFDYNMPYQASNDSHLAYADGNLYVSTDMGGIACVNASDGSLAWLSIYPRPLPSSAQTPWGMNTNAPMRVTPAFAGNPVIVHDGLIISLPGDAERLFVHDAATGEPRGSVEMRWPVEVAAPAGELPDEYDVLVGIIENRIVLAGDRSLVVVDLDRIVGDKTLREVSLVDDKMDFVRPSYLEDTIRGRPFLTGSSIYVPTAWKLYRLNATGDRALEMYPPGPADTWDVRPEERPGNVIYANDTLVVAGVDRINVYADLSMLRKRLDAAVAADSRSIAPRLRYADALFNAGQTEESIKWIDASIALLRAGGLISPGPDRDRVYDAVAQMYRQLSLQDGADGALGALLERMAATADTPVQQVGLQLARAHLARRTNDLAGAAQAYQALIEDENAGAVRIDADDGAVAARRLARDQIEAIIKQAPDAYDTIESRAKSAFAAAQASGDPQALFAVLDAYPNSRAGRDAAAEAIRRTMSGDVASRDLLRRAAPALVERTQRSQLLEAMMRLDLAGGDIDSALGRARSILQVEPGRPLSNLPQVGGRSLGGLGTGELVSTLQTLSFDAQDERLPRLDIPEQEPIFDTEHPLDVRGISSILVPSNPRRDRLVAVGRDDRAIKIFAPGDATPIGSIQLPNVADHAQTIWRGDSLLMTISTRVASLDTKASRVEWTFDPQDLKPQSAVRNSGLAVNDQGLLDPAVSTPMAAGQQPLKQGRVVIRNNRGVIVRPFEEGLTPGAWEADEVILRARENISYTRLVGDVVTIITSRGRVIALDAVTGKPRWQATFSDRPPSMVAVYDDVLVLGGNDESSSTLVAYRASDGGELLNHTYRGAVQRRLNTLATSGEGFLAAVHGDFIELFDLAAGGEEPIARYESGGQMIFAATRAQEQVQFCGDKLLVMVGPAGQQQQVKMFDLLTLAPTTVSDPVTRQSIERQFTPTYRDGLRPGDPSARMYIHKNRLLLRAGRGFVVYNVLGADARPWDRPLDRDLQAMSSQSPFFVKDGIVVVDWPAKPMENAPFAEINYFQRDTQPDGREIGRLMAEFELRRGDAKVQDRIQFVDGGFYTVWTNGVLSFVPVKKK